MTANKNSHFQSTHGPHDVGKTNALTSNSHPSKSSNENYLNPEFIMKQKIKLLEHREKVMASIRNFKEDFIQVSPEGLSEEGDVAQNHLDQKLTFSLKERELKNLREIDLALVRIEEGTYGLCEESGEPIEKARLEKQPWARLSLYYAELEEKENKRYYRPIG
jgi:DnaK suppressor protein